VKTMFIDPFPNFPKIRPKLSPEMRNIYDGHYLNSRGGLTPTTAVIHRIEGWLHRQVARDVENGGNDLVTLEIGAGTLNQLEYEPGVKVYDVVEPYKKLYRNSPMLPRVRNKYADIDEVELGKKYDRITTIASFEHITKLPEVVARGCLLLKDGGCMRVAIPNEGSLVWRMGWQMTSGVEFWLKYRLGYGQLMAYEHVNQAREIKAVMEYFLGKVEAKYLGLNAQLSIYHFYVGWKPRKKRAQIYLKK